LAHSAAFSCGSIFTTSTAKISSEFGGIDGGREVP